MAIQNNEFKYIRVISINNKDNGCEIFVEQYASKRDRDCLKEFNNNFAVFVEELKQAVTTIDKERIPSIARDIENMRQHIGIVGSDNLEFYSTLAHFKNSFVEPYNAAVNQFSIFYKGHQVNTLEEAYTLIRNNFNCQDSIKSC